MKIFRDKTFKDLTTFHIGGKIKYYLKVKTVAEIKEAIDLARRNNLKFFILGEGSDLLASDKDFPGVVIKYIGDSWKINGEFVTAEAGLPWDKLVEISVENGLFGLECLSGIPGTVGASPIQNIGAYGAEMATNFDGLKAYNLEKNEVKNFSKEQCKFGYRESIFKTKKYWQKYLILNVTFKLNRERKTKVNYESLKGVVDENAGIKEIREAVLKVRREKLENPKEHGNAGSFFKNPIINATRKKELIKKYPEAKIYPFEDRFKVFAGWLIENAGMKGKELGGAAVSPKHALILINKTGKATATDVYKLSEMIISEVDKKFGIKLKREVQLINFN